MSKIIRTIRQIILISLFSAVSAVSLFSESTIAPRFWISEAKLYYFCGGTEEYRYADAAKPGDPEQLRHNGRLFSFNNIPKTKFKAWPNQIRISGFAKTNFGTVIIVNSGFPLILDGYIKRLCPSEADDFLDLSAGLTSGTVFVKRTAGATEAEPLLSDGVFIHLYYDSIFDTKRLSVINLPKPVLIKLEQGVGSDCFKISIPEFGFSEDNYGWEPVEFLHKDDNNFVAWKCSDEKKTLFRYIRHDADGKPDDEISERHFRDEYSIYPAEEGPFALRGFLRAAREGFAGESLRDAGELFFRLTTALPGGEFPVYYHSPAPQKKANRMGTRPPVQLAACVEGDYWFILSDNQFFCCGDDIRRLSLPELPDGFEYTDFTVSGADVILGWEEVIFPYTGRSGMIHLKMRDIIE